MPDEAQLEGSFATSRQHLVECDVAAIRTAQRLSEILDLEWDLQKERESIYSKTIGQAWKAVMEALKAIAANRGWNHDNYWVLKDTLWALSKEFHNDKLHLLFVIVDGNRRNYFDSHLDSDDISRTIDAARELVNLLENISGLPPQPYVPTTLDQKRVMERLTRTE